MAIQVTIPGTTEKLIRSLAGMEVGASEFAVEIADPSRMTVWEARQSPLRPDDMLWQYG